MLLVAIMILVMSMRPSNEITNSEVYAVSFTTDRRAIFKAFIKLFENSIVPAVQPMHYICLFTRNNDSFR